MNVLCFAMPTRLLAPTLLAGAALAGCGGGSSGSTTLPSSTVAAGGTVSQSASDTARANTSAVSTKEGVSTYSAAVLANKPLAYYHLNDATSALADSGPNGISGIYGSGVTHQAATVTQGESSAASFPGGSVYNANGYAYTPPNSILRPATLTLEAWFKLSAPNATLHDLPIVVYGVSSKGVAYGLYIHGLGSGKQNLIYFQQNVNAATSLMLWGSPALLVGSIYHVVAVSDGTNVTTYVNGVLAKTAPYAGSINYLAGVTNGLSIGGANGSQAYGSAPFPGTIGQVAVYGAALSPATIVSHFLAGQIAPLITEAATPADTFVDSIGVTTHFENQYSPYVTQYSQVKSLLYASGIRHIRVAMMFGNPNFYSLMKDLARYNIYGSYTTQLGFTQSQITQFPSLVSPSLEAYEAPNEQDDQSNANWVGPCAAFQKSLYSWVKGNASTSQYPVLGPSLTKQTSFTALGDVSAYMDEANIHNYLSVYNPGTTGWGSTSQYGTYGSLAWNLRLANITSANKPAISTESGYGNVPNNPLSLDDRTFMRYMSRLFFIQFLGGVKRTYSYEFLQQLHTPPSPFDNFGLVKAGLTPSPAYAAIKSLIGSLSDKGPAFTTTALTYTLSGFNENVRHLWMQKRNGWYILAIWLEVPGWVTLNETGGDIIVPAQTVTLTTAKAFSSANISMMTEGGTFDGASIPWNGTSGSFSINDKVTLVTLKP